MTRIILYLFFLSYCVGRNPVVVSRYGILEGAEIRTKSNIPIDLFFGIPFARQLTPADRGTRPSPPERWKGTRSATRSGPACLQMNKVEDTEGIQYSEDCLYLNIYTPSKRSSSSLLPVLVFIHGGAFMTGSAVPAPSHPFANNFAQKDIVVVLIQYRLASQGFVSLNSSSIPGNMGLWDQTAALQYVSENIISFGGDKDRVTVMGQSAGAMSIGALSVSPFSRHLFSQAIQMSGSSWMLTTYTDLLSRSQAFFENLGCLEEKTRRECFQKATVDQIFEAQASIMAFTPTIGDDFIPIPPQDVRDLPVKPLLIGVMSLEGLLFTFFHTDPSIDPFVDRFSVELFLNESMVPYYKGRENKAYTRLSQYFLGETKQNSSFYIHQFAKINSNILIDIASLREVAAKSKSTNVFLYHFEHFNDDAFEDYAPVKETYHCHEFPYLLDTFVGEKFKFTAADYKVQKVFVDGIANFVIKGDPSTEEPWPKADERFTHLKIREQPIISKDLFKSDFEFWEQMKNLGYDAIFATPVSE